MSAGVLLILDEIARSPLNQYSDDEAHYRDYVFLIAQAILLSAKKDAIPTAGSFLLAIRDIVASGLDADRLDYTLRDPRASGLEIGAFDLDRIVTNCTLCRTGERFRIAFSDNSISAIESFFHQRYLLYSALVYQRTAVRAKAVLRELLARVLVYCYRCPNDAVAELAHRAGLVERDLCRKWTA